MPRSQRVDLPGETYHVTQHALDANALFRDDEDREMFLRLLAREVSRSRWRCLAYCLMRTHYHLVIELREGTLSRGFQHLNGTYAQLFNRRHGRRGHVFESRFRDRIVESEAHRLEVARYVHLNPVRVFQGLRPEEYEWSDYGATIGIHGQDPIVDPARALRPFGTRLEVARANYRAFVEETDYRVRRGQTRVRPRAAR